MPHGHIDAAARLDLVAGDTEEAQADAKRRLRRVQASLEEHEIGAAILASEANFTYVTGYSTPAWAITARPMAVLVEPDRCIAIVGSADLDSLTHAAPHVETVGYSEPALRIIDGFKLLDFAGAVVEITVRRLSRSRVGRLAVEMTLPSASGLPFAAISQLESSLGVGLVDAAPLMWGLRQHKTDYEIRRLQTVGMALGKMYELFEGRARPGLTERALHALVMATAAEVDVDRLGFSLVIAGDGSPDGPPGERRWLEGQLLYLDTCLVRDGYWSDFSRHYAADDVRTEHEEAYARIVAAARAGRTACRAGRGVADVASAIYSRLPSPTGQLTSIGRVGHGIGLDLTEPPSVNLADETRLSEGMTLCVEPMGSFRFGSLMSEEMILVTNVAPRLLSPEFPPALPVLSR